MIKALLLIFNGVPTWERIVEARRTILFILSLHLLPLLLLGTGGEVYGLIHWGKPRSSEYGNPLPLAQNAAIQYGLCKIALGLVVVLVVAKIVQSLATSFHGRQTYTQTFTCVAYGISPLFLVNLLNALPHMPAWVTWAIGVALCASVLYQGLPRVLMPDPPHTLGLYFMSVLMLVMTTALAQFVTSMILDHAIHNTITPASALLKT